MDGQSAILVTISDELNIVIPLHTTNTANYLDININQIEQIMREKKEFHFHCSSSPSRLFEVLTIRISKSSKEAYYFNARGLFADSLVLVFTSAGAASTVQQRILGIRSRIPCNLGTSQSGPVDISRQLSEDLDEPSAMQLVTKLSEQLSNDLVSATGQANETHRKNSTTSVAHLSLPECNESPLEYISQPKLSTSVASPHDGNTPQLMALIDGAISPVEPHQFDELSSKLTTVEYNFEDTSDDESPNPAKRLGGPSLLGCGQAIWDRQCTLASKYVGLPADDCPVRIPSIEQDENYENPYHAKTKTYISRKKHTNQTESQPFERVGQRGMSKNFSSPDVKIGRVGRQDLTKLSQRMRRNVGEPPIGLSLFPEPTYGDATKKDRRKREDSRPALRTNFLFPDRQPKDLELFRVQSRGQIGGKSKTASADEQNRYEDEFDFPISARKAPSVSAAHVPTPIAVMCAQSSFNAARKPKTKPIPPPKPTLNCPSKRPDSQIHDGRRPKAIAGTTASISSKRIRNNEDDDATDETNWNPGFVVDQAKGSKPPQGQRKKQLNRKSQPRMKPIRAKDDLAFSTHKALNPKIQKSRKLKAVPVPLAQSRSRRVAALTANRKIQGLVGSDESEDEEDVESIHVKEKSIKRPGQENRTPMSHPSAIMQSNSSIINANSRSPFITSREGKGPIMSNHDTATITSAVPCVVPTNNENEKAESSDGVDILTDKLVQLANGVKIDDNTRQSLPVNASDTLPLDGRSDHRPQSELPTVNLKTLEVQDSATGATLEEPELVHDNTMPLPTFTYKTLTPEANPSDHVDALNDTGSGFFEEATAFSHEDSKSLVENPTDEGTSKSPTLDSNFENIHDPSACEEVNIDNIPTLANASSNPIKSTPKVSVAAKLQSALSSVKKLHFPTKTMEKLQRISKGGALTGAEVTAPRLDNTVLDNMATRGTKETIVSSKQAVCPDAMRFGQGLVEENGVPSLKKTLQRRESQPGPTVDSTMPPVTQSSHRTPTTCAQVRSSIITPYALEAKNDAEIGKSDKVISINEASLQGVQKSSKSLSLNPDSGKTNSETFQGDLEGRILSALRAKNVQHGLEGSSKQEFDSAKLTHTSPMDKSRAQLVMDEVVHADKPTIALLDCDRKPNVISFDSKGPRNQGILSSRRVRPVQAPDDQTPEMSVNVKNKALKRKIQDFGEDNFSSVGNEAAVKRPRTSIDVPRTDEKAPERVQKRSISIIKESTQKTSSQSTRVDENGSPLPFLDSRKIGFQRSKRRISFENAAQSPVAKQGAEDGNDLFMSKDGLEVLSPGLPFLRNLSPQSASSFRFVPLSCTKHRPSSPNAPSEIIGEYTAHKVDSSGKFVNIRTDNVVMAVRPPDPFVGIQKNRQNDFIELLRRSSNIPDKGSSAIAATTAQDPDKTLVMGDLAREKNNSDASSIRPSPSSDSSESNEYSPQDYPSSSGDGDDEDDEWAAALQPHQCETLEVLYEISHVSQRPLSLEVLVIS